MKHLGRRWTLLLVAALIVASGSPAYTAAPITLERHLDTAERVAPPYITLPGKTLCVCQFFDASSSTNVGWLNSYTTVSIEPSGEFSRVGIVCMR